MKKKIEVNFFIESSKWSRNKAKFIKISTNTTKKMRNYFDSNSYYNINLIISDKKNVKQLNKKYKNKDKDTDVLTFVSKLKNKNLGNTFYCDIFFSIDTIESFIKKNKVTIYNHLNHLLIHSILHINGYDHKNSSEFNKMKNEEIKLLRKIGISNPYFY